MEQKISVIIDVHLINNDFDRCLESLIKQTYKNIEIILNVKNNYEEAKKLVEIDNRIVVTNNYKEVCTGDYLFFINQEDYLSIDYFRLMLSDCESDLIISNIVFDNVNTKKINNLFTSALNLNLNIEKNKTMFLNEFKEYLEYGNLLVSKELYLLDIESIVKSAKKITQNPSSIYYCSKDINCSKYSDYSNKLEELKNKMLLDEFKYISFDIFDTLILRPFHKPSDLFEILDIKYFELTKSKTSFKKIRMESESLLRGEVAKKDKTIQDVTITEIYDYISYTYKIDKAITNKLREFEIKLEIEFCVPRKVSKEIFDMLLYVGKDVILVSDMYLEHENILAILEKNQYTNFKKLYVSSKFKKIKASGQLFEFVIQDLNCKPHEIMHIGDNYNADVNSANKVGVNGTYYPRTLEIFENKVEQIKTNNLSNFINRELNDSNGLKLAKALVGNKMFDNPFTSVDIENNFNYNYYNLGYYVIGTYLVSVLEDLKKIKSNKIGVLTEYNYVVYEGLKILNKYEKSFEEIVSIDITREEILTLIVNTESDLLNMPLDYYKYSSDDIVKMLQCDTSNQIQTNSNKFGNVREFHEFIKELTPYYFNNKNIQSNISELQNKIKKYDELDFVFDCSNYGNILDFFNTNTKQLLDFSNIEEIFVRDSETIEMATIQKGILDFVEDFYSEHCKYTEYFTVNNGQFKNVFNNFFNEVNNKDKDMFENIYINECVYEGCSKISLLNFMSKRDIKYAFQNSENKVVMNSVINNRKIVCFGSGSTFSNFINKNYDIDVEFILDNDTSKRGKLVGDYEIKIPVDINNLSEYFIVITSIYYKQIEEQLIKLGMFKYSDFICYTDI